MRLALAFLLAAIAVGPAAAQQPQPQPQPKAIQKKPASPPPKPVEQAQPKPLDPEQEKAKEQEEMLRQRLILKERFNKGYDVQVENANDRIEAKCKAEARRLISAFHPIKRRRFAQECIDKRRRH